MAEYERCKKDTHNFKFLTGDMLIQNRYYLEILRKLCNLTILDMDQIYLDKYSKRFRSSNYELYYPSRKLGKKLADRLAKILLNKLEDAKEINFNLILQYNQRIKPNKDNYTRGADFENRIESHLIKNKIVFEKHSRLSGKSGIFHKVDFLIGNRFDPVMVIEAKKSNSARHNFMIVAKELVATAMDLGEKRLNYVVILDTKWNKNAINFLKHYCKVFNIEEIDEVIKIIKDEKGM